MTGGQQTLERMKDAPQVVRGLRPAGLSGGGLAFVSILSFLLCLVIVELTLYFAGIGEEEICAADPELGWVHRQNKRVTWRREGYSQSYFGRDGLREPGVTVARRAGTLRVVLLGDSAAEGLQVPLEQSFGKIMEERLKLELNQDVEVLNFAVLGYSQIQNALLLERILPSYKPDLVLYCYSNRDAAENIETWSPKGVMAFGNRPYAIKEGGKDLVVSSEPVLNSFNQPQVRFWESFDWLKHHSRIWGALAANKPKLTLHNPLVDDIVRLVRDPGAVFGGTAGSTAAPSFKIKFFEDNKTVKTQVAESGGSSTVKSYSPAQRSIYLSTIKDTFDGVLGRMNSSCKKQGSGFAVITMPARLELMESKIKPQALFDVGYKDELEFITQSCVQNSIPLLDIQTRAGSLSKVDCEKLFYSLHFAPEGHRYIAAQSSDFVGSLLK